MHDHLGGGVIGNVYPQAAMWRKDADARVEPVERELFVLGARHAVIPLVVRDIPVERWIGEDQIDLATIWQRGKDVTAVTDIKTCVGVACHVVRLEYRGGCGQMVAHGTAAILRLGLTCRHHSGV